MSVQLHSWILETLKSTVRLLHLLPSVPYGEEKFHHWGTITSTLNWCEEDYVLTQYCAELINSLTSLLFVVLAIRGMRSCIINRHDTVFFIALFGYLCVGLGSFLFHSTLWYSMQLVDELSMIYTTCLMVWASFSRGMSVGYSTFLGFVLFVFAVGMSVIYHYLQDPRFHQNGYALLSALFLFHSMYLQETKIRSVDARCVNRLWRLIGWGINVFLSGFALWNIDNIFCDELRNWRRSVGLPWAVLAEGHGWWHLLTGLGAYYGLQYGIWLRYCLEGKQDEYELYWPSIWSIPDVRWKR